MHLEGECRIASGKWTGEPLSNIIKRHPDYVSDVFGCEKKSEDLSSGFPLLVKLIDAKKALSVQVHPDDEYAGIHENGARGKTELWYVLDAAKNSNIFYGFQKDSSRAEVEKALCEGSIEALLQRVPVKRGDIFLWSREQSMRLVREY